MKHENWPKVMEFCDQSWNFTNFAPKFYQICCVFFATKKLRSNLESPHFPMFLQNVANTTSGREMVMENQVMVMEKYLVKSVGTLPVVLHWLPI